MPDGEAAEWFYRDPMAGTVKGPLKLVELSNLLAAGGISGETLTRCGDYGVWRQLQERPEFDSLRKSAALARNASRPEEPRESDPAIFSAKWFYGFGIVAVGMLGYYTRISSRGGGQGLPLDWLVQIVRHLLGYKS